MRVGRLSICLRYISRINLPTAVLFVLFFMVYLTVEISSVTERDDTLYTIVITTSLPIFIHISTLHNYVERNMLH